MKRICKQCGAEFTLTQDEISFYQSKNLHIPKRCEKCRMENRTGGKTGTGMRPVSSGKKLTGNDYESVKTPGQVVRAYDAGKNDKKKVWIAVAAVLLLLAACI
ncbi:MAG: zinc-ribbon domain containing protein, partial [Lachnospiraceae bacterium]|nr:zinc-ribbon domain containing protein [Lachnospiraceae bacterium]